MLNGNIVVRVKGIDRKPYVEVPCLLTYATTKPSNLFCGSPLPDFQELSLLRQLETFTKLIVSIR